MRYISTRGGAPADFADVLLGGPAPDGGLYLPEYWPRIKRQEIAAFAALPYAEVAFRVMFPFIGKAFSERIPAPMSTALSSAVDPSGQGYQFGIRRTSRPAGISSNSSMSECSPSRT